MNNDIINYKTNVTRSGFLFLAVTAILFFCSAEYVSGQQQGFRLFDPSGKCLFNTNSGAKTVAENKEKEMSANVSGGTGTSSGSPWAPTTAQTTEPPRPEQIQAISWTSQRPNGAVLFPQSLQERGPMVVVEPKSIVAPIGTEVVLVSSFIGPENTYLMTDQKLEWSLDGTGHFLTTNPNMCLVSCDLDSPRKNSDKFVVTKTSGQLWRIHRGTSTPLDDISILKGQSWATVQSGVEGVSSVSVLSPFIDDWKKRSATCQINWIDAELFFPGSGIAPAGESRTLTTSVVRKSNPASGREGWIVRYDIVSGPPAGFGPTLAQSLETMTDTNGQANVVLTQQTPSAGTSRVAVRIIRPGSATTERITVAERTVSQSWSSGSFFNLKITGPPSIKLGENASYQIDVTNLTETSQDGVVRLPVPAGTQLANTVPTAAVEGNVAVWNLMNIPPRGNVTVRFDLNIQTAGAIDLNPRIDRRTAAASANPNITTTPGIISGSTPPSGTGTNPAPPTSGTTPFPTPNTQPPVTTPTTASPEPVTFDVVDPFPATVAVGQDISGVLSMKNPSQRDLPSVTLSTTMPDDVLFVNEGHEYRGPTIRFDPYPISQIVAGKYSFTYRASTPGEKTVTIEAKDGSGTLLDRYTLRFTATPASGNGTNATGTNSPGNAAPAVELELTPSGEGSPSFVTGTRVLFSCKITNRENYALSGLKLLCTPERNRTAAPWTLVSSIPAGAQPVSSSGSFLLNVPTIPANGETTVSLTFDAAKPMVNGVFTAEVRSDSSAQSLASREFYYSISEKRK